MLKQAFCKLSQAIQVIFIGLIKIYQWTFSPLFGNCCRFHPSCSVYAQAAIRQYGPIKGVYLMLRRVLRCHPFHEGGYDPVPNQFKTKEG